MAEFKKYPSIGQFRNVIKDIEYHFPEGKRVFPVYGTVKLHGTNAAIGYDPETKEIWAQSRKNILDIHNDNAGFANWVESEEEYLLSSFDELNLTHKTWIFGEWCGGNIQGNVGIKGLDKMFVVFAVYSERNQDNEFPGWDNIYLIDRFMSSSLVRNIYSSHLNFEEYYMEIDFDRPHLFTNELARLTEQVENECPVAKSFGVENGVGEGIVWTVYDHESRKNFQFKVKGEKHSSSNVKTLATVDIEKMRSVDDFVRYSVTENRLKQGIKELFDGEELLQSKTGDFVRWVMNDIIKEESDTMEGSGLTKKDVSKYCSKAASKWYLQEVFS